MTRDDRFAVVEEELERDWYERRVLLFCVELKLRNQLSKGFVVILAGVLLRPYRLGKARPTFFAWAALVSWLVLLCALLAPRALQFIAYMNAAESNERLLIQATLFTLSTVAVMVVAAWRLTRWSMQT